MGIGIGAVCHVDHKQTAPFQTLHVCFEAREEVIEMFKNGTLDAAEAMKLLAEQQHEVTASSGGPGVGSKRPLPPPEEAHDAEIDEVIDDVEQDDGSRLDSCSDIF